MATVTVNEAARLVGRSRRGIYRDMEGGRLSYKTDRDGHRRIDTSELERLHGPLRIDPVVTPARATDTPEAERLLAELVELTKRQAEELAGMRKELREIRRLPAPPEVEGGDRLKGEEGANKFSALVQALKGKQGTS